MKIRWSVPLLFLLATVLGWSAGTPDAESCIRFFPPPPPPPEEGHDPNEDDPEHEEEPEQAPPPPPPEPEETNPDPEDAPEDDTAPDPEQNPDPEPTPDPAPPEDTPPEDGPTTPPSDPMPPQAPPRGGPITAPKLPTKPGGNATGGRRKAGVDLASWQTWWELNRVQFFPRRWVRPVVTPREGELVRTGPEALHPDLVRVAMWPALRKLKDHKHVFVQEAALITMGRSAADDEQRAEAREILHKKLKHRNRLIARAAALGLFYVADESSVLPMYDVASDEKADEDVRAFLALTLTNLEHPMATGLLQKLADVRKGYFELVASALMGLGYNGARTGDPAIPEFLKQIAFHTKGVRHELRALAVESFGRIGDPTTCIAPLLKGLSDRNVHVRRSSAIALGVLDYRTPAERQIAKIEAPYKEFENPPISSVDKVRLQALRGQIDVQRKDLRKPIAKVLKQLGEVMRRDNDTFVRRMAAVSMGRMNALTPSPLAQRYLQAALKKNRLGMREFALLSLAMGNATGALGSALETSMERNPATRGAACIAMGMIGNKDRENPIADESRAQVVARLQHIMKKDPNPMVRGYAALAAGIVGTPSASLSIRSLIKRTKSPHARAYGALGLALLGTAEAADDMVGFLDSNQMRNGFVSSHVVYAIGLTKDRRPKTLKSLIDTATNGKDQYVQAATIAALGFLSTGEFYPQRHLMARGYNYLLGMDYIDTYFYKL